MGSIHNGCVLVADFISNFLRKSSIEPGRGASSMEYLVAGFISNFLRKSSIEPGRGASRLAHRSMAEANLTINGRFASAIDRCNQI